MKKLLRYNTRHTLYHHPSYTQRGGARIVLGWSLNPIGSMHDGRQTSLTEPLWMFRLRQRWFCHAGDTMCGAARATWDWGPDGNRTCSHCGSIHPDDLMKICRLVPTDDRYGIEGTDKSYKVYVRQPGVRNASEGAIKFYMTHAPTAPTAEEQELFSTARRVTHERFMARYAR